MDQLQGQRILLGVSGGIAAYKTPDLVRKLKAAGAEVRVVLTPSGAEFVSALSLQAVSGLSVHDSLLDKDAEAAMGHIELAKWADQILIAPASANVIARLAHGMADDLLTTLCLASAAPITLCPAMNQQMYGAQATQDNLTTLKQRGVTLLGPASGEQACGDVGPGRMLEPEQIVAALSAPVSGKLAGVKVLLTAGPTREALDPVRYLTNQSSGKMGYALAHAAARMGAQVTLVSGPVALSVPVGVNCIEVESCQQMHEAVMTEVENADIFIGCAAVADYRPEQNEPQKIKKSKDKLTLTFIKNPDILAEVAALPKRPFTVGFAAETQDVAHYARQKLEKKRLDMIAANDVSASDRGFNTNLNALTVLWQNGEAELPCTDKSTLAQALLDLIAQHYKNNQNHA
ncbi:Phosphopantothenoylcysteine decarboxylase [Saliniradius amylolyticus]|uniref:Coenzyme A biosynthesis bifunctional protein CoaBC n=1 Tax=Saliniradius amylolyticus TaxID=2183582 RepID=A0A2S2DYU0_9ALTE|nr:bifunctional phosphopantothenoylcysteine decarboxylase/phosphopantothenate--cysteine ligase CoaBC [Saliniradius amylolyticus]AWL10568.1 Phosphopantothenoylcysteine decarboxylase [Saliniradius amylolyticus]